jgi:cytochrome c556
MDAQHQPCRLTSRILAAMFLIAAGTTGVSAQHAAHTVDDDRERIVLPAPARNMVLAEMRMMLESIAGVVAALSEGDTAAAAEAARGSGMAMAVDVDPVLRELLPAAFVELGMSTHRGFDALADQIEQGADQEMALAELGALMQNCIACHAAYRADEVP